MHADDARPLSLPDRWAARARLGTAGRPTPSAVRWLRNIVRPLARVLHRATLEGTANLPASGPFVLVANHSAVGIAEISAFAALYIEHVGEDRPLAGVAHPGGFFLWPASVCLRHVGAVPSTRAATEKTLEAGIPLLMFPGGDHEAFRPVWQAYKVDFAGRIGFLRLARAAKVPIVPLGIRGSHFTAPILWRSRWILPWLFVMPRLAGVKRWPLSLLGLLGAIAIVVAAPLSYPWRFFAAWAWMASPFALVSWIPWTIRMRIGAPIHPDELFGADGGDDELRRALARVQAAVQALVTGG